MKFQQIKRVLHNPDAVFKLIFTGNKYEVKKTI